ncbi:glutamate-5-semialdehyde dehydrogenase [Alphaproteobacteria bacterium]|nr:glutamate-5-semialdehyde dehydrogenase [Alphaproteobacteria bacterium]
MSETIQLEAQMNALGRKSAIAARTLGLASRAQKDAVLLDTAAQLRAQSQDILSANAADLKLAEAENLPAARIDRIMLDEARLDGIAKALEAIATLPDPVGELMQAWTPEHNKLNISRVRVPLGVIGVIYESRPNVTADAAALCLKSGNAVILRGSSEIMNSAKAIAACFASALRANGMDEACVQLVPTADRAAVGMMLAGLDNTIDVIVPRGGKNLVARVQDEARVPVFAHLDGVCHTYVHEDADLEMARSVVLNAKMRRVGICGATETLLVDSACASTHLKPLIDALEESGCMVRGDSYAQAANPKVTPADEADWFTEYLDSVISVKCVDGLQDAINHINHYGSHHTDAIITQNAEAAEIFLNQVDSAIVMQNCSTQFADGGEFGMGAEIGIATGRFHARGPVGLEQLTTFKYVVRGDGQTRPK